MLFKTKKQREEEEYFARMEKRLQEKKQIERVITPGRLPKEETKPSQKKKIISPLLKLLKTKSKVGRKAISRKARGTERLLKLEPLTKRPKRILTAREKALQKIIQKRQGISNVNLQEVLRKFYEDRSQHLLRHHRGSRELSFKTRQELERILQIQNLSKTADMKQQRILRERNILGKSMNLMKAHYNLNKTRLDFSGVTKDNILSAENIFRDDPEHHILKPKRLNILQTKEAGNDLKF